MRILEAINSRQAGQGTDPKPYADVDENLFVVWMTYANYGRAHHVTGNITRIEKHLTKVGGMVVDALEQNGQPADQTRADVLFDDTKEYRLGVAYIMFRPKAGTKFDPESAVAGLKGVAGFKPKPK